MNYQELYTFLFIGKETDFYINLVDQEEIDVCGQKKRAIFIKTTPAAPVIIDLKIKQK